MELETSEQLKYIYMCVCVCVYIYVYIKSRFVNALLFYVNLKHSVFCKYFAAVSVASSVHVTLELHFHNILHNNP